MPPNVKELKGSGDFQKGPSGVKGKGLAIILGAADQDEAWDAADGYFPEQVGGIPRGSIDVTDAGQAADGTGIFMVEVDYSSEVRSDAPAGVAGQNPDPANHPEKSVPVGREQSFSTKGGTQHIVNSRSVDYSRAAPGKVPSDPKKRIGDSEKGTAGCDIISPQPVFTIKFKVSAMQLGYVNLVMQMTATVNKSTWRGFNPGEVLFEGLDADYRDGDGWNLTYSFRYSPNDPWLPEDVAAGGLDIGNGIDHLTKKGWQYMDVRFERVESQGHLIDQPYEVHFHDVYRYTEFSLLGID